MKRILFPAILFFSLGFISACGGKSSTNEEPQAKEEKHEDENNEPGTTSLTQAQKMQLQQEVEKNQSMLSFYESAGLKQAESIIKAATLAYRAGEISFAELSQFLTQAIEIQKNYLDNLNGYNQSVIQYYYYSNQ